jgi:hypothetical protein
MARVLLLTNTLGASAEVLPALGLLQHQVRILPAEASVLVDAPDTDLVIIDARRDLPAVKSLTIQLVSCRVISSFQFLLQSLYSSCTSAILVLTS